MILFKRTTLMFFLIIFFLSENYSMDSIGMNTESELQENKWWEFLEADISKTSCLKYHIYTLFNNFFRKWCGVYKRVELSYGEFFYGSVSGIGWYPQFLNFHDHFRMGFLEISYNLITPIYHIAIILFSKNIDFHATDFTCLLTGFSFNIINFKIYNGLIKLNFINPFHVFFIFCDDDLSRGFNPKEWEYKPKWPDYCYFGKELKSLSEIKKEWKKEDTTWEKKKELLTKMFFYFLNIILPEIYFDISFFYNSDEKQQ